MGKGKIGEIKMKYYTRLVLYPDGTFKEIKVPKKEVEKSLNSLIKENKEVFDILKKL